MKREREIEVYNGFYSVKTAYLSSIHLFGESLLELCACSSRRDIAGIEVADVLPLAVRGCSEV